MLKLLLKIENTTLLAFLEVITEDCSSKMIQVSSPESFTALSCSPKKSVPWSLSTSINSLD